MLIDFRERGREGRKEGENTDVLPLVHALTGDQTHNLGMCPDQESNPWPFDLWDEAPTNWATLAMTNIIFLFKKRKRKNTLQWGNSLKTKQTKREGN